MRKDSFIAWSEMNLCNFDHGGIYGQTIQTNKLQNKRKTLFFYLQLHFKSKICYPKIDSLMMNCTISKSIFDLRDDVSAQ